MRILVIEDEPKIAGFVRQGLTEQGFEVDIARRGDEGFVVAKTGGHDLLILDLMLPRRDGWDILGALRRDGYAAPILCLTARDAIADRVRGLELGADDYLTKPFAFAELLARVRALLRRGRTRGDGELAAITVADLRIDVAHQCVWRGASALQLTAREYAVLWLLARHASEVVPRGVIAHEVWGMRGAADSRAIDVTMYRLRSKVDDGFTPTLIHTVRSVGYVLEAR